MAAASHMAAAAILASVAATAHCISALLLSREKKYRACAKNGWRCGRAIAGAACGRCVRVRKGVRFRKASFLLYVGD